MSSFFQMLDISIWRSNLSVVEGRKKERRPSPHLCKRREKNFQDPDIRNEKVTRILRLLVMLMGPNLKWNFIHILKSNNEISFRCSSHFLLALMISRSECREREKRKKKKRSPRCFDSVLLLMTWALLWPPQNRLMNHYRGENHHDWSY